MDGSNEPSRAAEVLATAACAFLDGLPPTADVPRRWPPLRATRPFEPRHLPVLTWLAAVFAVPSSSAADLVDTMKARAGMLSWGQTYGEQDFGPAFLERYGWTEVIGSRGPIPSDDVAVGFLLLGPDTTYPAHAHEAEEIYVPLSGVASWMRGDEGFVERAVGEVIHHRSWVPHAMHTGAEPSRAAGPLSVHPQGGGRAARGRRGAGRRCGAPSADHGRDD